MMEDQEFETTRRMVRLATLLWAAGSAGLTPITLQRLHTLVFLSDVLAPVWGIPPLDGKLLKRSQGPFYPLVQRDLDRMVGTGLVLISNLGYTDQGEDRWRLEGSYELSQTRSEAFVLALTTWSSGRYQAQYLREVAFAVSALDLVDLEIASSEDATYGDPVVGDGNVVDFADWADANASANAARFLGSLAPTGHVGTASEQLHLYIQHLSGRLHAANR